jgi:hypothetical protein
MRRSIGLAMTALAVVVASCGGSSSSPSSATPASTPAPATETGGASGTSLQLSADPSGQLKYDKQSLAATASKFTITLANMSPMPHDVKSVERPAPFRASILVCVVGVSHGSSWVDLPTQRDVRTRVWEWRRDPISARHRRRRRMCFIRRVATGLRLSARRTGWICTRQPTRSG